MTAGTDRRSFLAALGALSGLAGPLAGCLDPTSVGAAGPADWPLRRRDPARTGATAGSAGPATARTRWTFEAPGPLTAPVVVGDRVYAAADGLYALGKATGEASWRRPAALRRPAPPAFADGTVFGSFGRSRRAVVADAGTDRWFTSNTTHRFHEPVPADGTVYLGATRVRYSTDFEASVLALDPADGAVRWRTPVGANVLPPFAPAVAGGRVVVGRDRVSALDAETGAVDWTYAAADLSVFRNPAVADGVVYIGALRPTDGIPAGALLALDADDGTRKWRLDTELRPSPPATIDGTVYTAADRVLAVRAADGQPRWRAGSDRFLTAAPAATDRRVYAASLDGTLLALDAADGATVWAYETGAGLLSDPAVADGAVYVGSADGTLFAIGE